MGKQSSTCRFLEESTPLPTSKGTKKLARKKEKNECRSRNLEEEIEKVKDETKVTGHEAAKRHSLAGS